MQRDNAGGGARDLHRLGEVAIALAGDVQALSFRQATASQTEDQVVVVEFCDDQMGHQRRDIRCQPEVAAPRHFIGLPD